MLDCPIGELMDERICMIWLERHLHPSGLTCPHAGHAERRLFRGPGDFPVSRCRACQGDDTRLIGTVCATTRQRTATPGQFFGSLR